MRATFKLWHEADRVHYVMFDQEDSRRLPHEVTQFPMGSHRMNELLPRLLSALNGVEELRRRIDYASFLTTQSGDALIALTYNRAIDTEVWRAAASSLVTALGEGVTLVGRSRHVKLVEGSESSSVIERLVVPGRAEDQRPGEGRRGEAAQPSRGDGMESGTDGGSTCRSTSGHDAAILLHQMDGEFSQPNAGVCERMLGWAWDVTAGLDATDLCELYCGNGCFTVALAPRFRRVFATELTKASIALAHANLAANGVGNVQLGRLSASEFTQAYAGERAFHRLGGIDLGEYDFSTLLVDPPRSGLDETCVKLAARFERVVYISCNPETLARDVSTLRGTHRIVRAAAFDQFAYTPHLEAGVLLERCVCEVT